MKKLNTKLQDHTVDRNQLIRGHKPKTGFKMLRKIDVFGYPIKLNFNGDSEIRSTFGGFVSIFAISSWIIFATIVSLRFFHPSNKPTSHNFTSTYSEPADMINPQNYSQNGLNMYATLEKQGNFDRQNLRRFVNVSFIYGNETEQTLIPAVMCKKDLFNYNDELLNLYEEYIAHLNADYTFCPMVDEYKKAII